MSAAALERSDETTRLATLLRARLGEDLVASLSSEFGESQSPSFLEFLVSRGVLSPSQAHTVRAVLKGYVTVPADALLADLRWSPGQHDATKQTLQGVAPLPERATPLPLSGLPTTMTPVPRPSVCPSAGPGDSLRAALASASRPSPVPARPAQEDSLGARLAPPSAPAHQTTARVSNLEPTPTGASEAGVELKNRETSTGASSASRASTAGDARQASGTSSVGSTNGDRPVSAAGTTAADAPPPPTSASTWTSGAFARGVAASPSAPSRVSPASSESVRAAVQALPPPPSAPWPPPRPSSPFAAPVTGAMASSVMPRPSASAGGVRPMPPASAPPPVRPSSPEFSRLPRPSPGGSMSLAALADARRAEAQPQPEPTAAPIQLTAQAPTLRVGQTLGRYQLQELLGEGSTALTFRSFHEALQIPVALKVYRPTDRVAQDTLRERFIREARVLARLDHPHIVRVLDVDEVQGVPFIVFEYVGAMSMDELVRATGHLGVPRTVRIARDVASALAAAAEHGLLHRDVKPANILVRKDGLVKLADFGLAHSQHGAKEGGGLVYGTPAFMSPEAITTPGSVDVRSDMYSLGCTVFYALSGQAPYERANPMDTMRAQVSDPVPRLKETPPAIEALVTRLLAKTPQERFSTWTDVVQAFDGVSQADGSPVRNVEPNVTGGGALSTIARKMSELFKGR